MSTSERTVPASGEICGAQASVKPHTTVQPATTRPLQDRVDVFLNSMKACDCAERTSCPSLVQGVATVTPTLSTSLPTAIHTVNPVRSFQRTFLLEQDQREQQFSPPGPSDTSIAVSNKCVKTRLLTKTLSGDGCRSRTKRLRSESTRSPIEATQEATLMPQDRSDRVGRRMARPLVATRSACFPALRQFRPTFVQTVVQATPDCRQHNAANVHSSTSTIHAPVHEHASPPSSCGIPTGNDVGLGAPIVNDLVSLLSEIDGEAPPSTSAMDSEKLAEQFNAVEKLTPLQRAELDWEIHIRAMERVLEANRSHGLPSGNIPVDALQVLSQMIGNLSTLNTKLLYAQMQNVLDTHHRNAQRIDEVFQGLAGINKRQKTFGHQKSKP